MLLSIIKQKMNIDLDYSLFSLLYLDKILEQMVGLQNATCSREISS